MKIGFLHPGSMGVSLAASAHAGGNTVYWVSKGRSEATRTRATEHGLADAGTLEALCAQADAIVSICPPHAAESVAGQVAACGFQGLYLDANAIAPQVVRRIGEVMTAAGATCVDGSVIGGPAWTPGRTWLYLSGPAADRVAAFFAGGPLETAVIGDEIGQASALKMCFAAYTKGTTALLAGILATADALGVREALDGQWSRGGSDFAEQTARRVRGVTDRAWRFAGELEQISATFEAAGVPGGFHAAGAEIYRRLAHFKDAAELPPLEDVLAAILEGDRDV